MIHSDNDSKIFPMGKTINLPFLLALKAWQEIGFTPKLCNSDMISGYQNLLKETFVLIEL